MSTTAATSTTTFWARCSRGWRRFWARAPRQLRVTTAGRVLLLLAVVCGLLALNSGNNLLFFVWGMELGAILVSGFLSEATLRPLTLQAALPAQARVGENSFVALTLGNTWRLLPAFAVQTLARVRCGGEEQWAYAPYELRLAGAQARQLFAPLVPRRRGRLQLQLLLARTAYPFGLFVKDRRFPLPLDAGWVWPARVATGELAHAVTVAMGETPAGRAGNGDDFFALRPYQQGDPPARVLWRRAAGGRPLMVREQEATSAQRVTLVLQLRPLQAFAPGESGTGAAADALKAEHERTLALVGSLAEALVELGLGVGLWTHGHHVEPGEGPAAARRQCHRLLDALAQLNLDLPLAPLPPAAPVRQALQLVGLAALPDAGGYPELDLRAAAVRVGEGAP